MIRVVLPRRAAGWCGPIKAIDEDWEGGVSAASGDVEVASIPGDEVCLAAPDRLKGAADGGRDDPHEGDGDDETCFSDSKLQDGISMGISRNLIDTHSVEQLIDRTLGGNHHHLPQLYLPLLLNLLPQPNPPNQPQQVNIRRRQDRPRDRQDRSHRRRIDPPRIEHALSKDDVYVLRGDGEAPGGEDDERDDEDDGGTETANFGD